MNEEWKSIPGFQTYEASSEGRIQSLGRTTIRQGKFTVLKSRIIRITKREGMYPFCTMWNGTKLRVVKAHRLIAAAFIPNPLNLKCINHIDGNKNNNRISNLEWCSSSHNNQHAYDIGLKIPQRGEDASSAKLTEGEVLEIRARYPGETQKSLAAQFHVCKWTVNDIICRRSWIHI